MRLFTSLTQNDGPVGLTIGNFDGVHLGHQTLLTELRGKIGPRGSLIVVTFSPHPSHVLPHLSKVPHLSSQPLKIKYLQHAGVDLCYFLDFNHQVAELSYRAFLEQLPHFDYLLLGKGASLGNKREGTEERIQALSKEMGFEVHYLSKKVGPFGIISSGGIRAAIKEGSLDLAAQLLGRPFTLLAHSSQGKITIEDDLCLPPHGSYSVLVCSDQGIFRGRIEMFETLELADLPRPIEGTIEILFDPLHL